MDTVSTAEHLFTDRVLPALLHRMRKIPLKIGVRIEPPTIIYIYKEAGALRMRSMPLRNLWTNSDLDYVIEDFRNRHGEHIEDVPDFALRKMINLIKIAKRGKTVDEALKELNGLGKRTSLEESSVFDKLKNNLRSTSADNGFLNSPTKTGNEEINIGFKRKEPIRKTNFSTSLFDEIRIAESKMTPPRAPLGRTNSFDFPDMNVTRRPGTLEAGNFELSTSFNSLRTPEPPAGRKAGSSYLLDLEKEMDEIEKKEAPERLPGRTGKAKEADENKPRAEKPARQKHEDDTDVEFDDSDNPLDDPDDDFW